MYNTRRDIRLCKKVLLCNLLSNSNTWITVSYYKLGYFVSHTAHTIFIYLYFLYICVYFSYIYLSISLFCLFCLLFLLKQDLKDSDLCNQVPALIMKSFLQHLFNHLYCSLTCALGGFLIWLTDGMSVVHVFDKIWHS